MSDHNAYWFRRGAKYVLEYLEEVYGEGIKETDIWKDFMDDADE